MPYDHQFNTFNSIIDVNKHEEKPCPYDKVGCIFKHEIAPECRFNLKCTFKLCQFTHTTKKGEEVAHRQEVETLNEGVVENRGHLLPAIISTDRTIAHKELMKPLEDAEAVELNEENDYEDSESFRADMEGSEDEDNYSEDSDSSDSWEGGYESDSMYTEDQKKEMLWIVQQEKEAWRMLQQKVNSQVKTRMLHKV